MILSMTGFGRGAASCGTTTYTIDIKSLNAKTTDIRLKMPANMAEKEFSIRKILTDGIVRGRIDVFITSDSQEGNGDFHIKEHLFVKFYNQLVGLHQKLEAKDTDIFALVASMPSVVQEDTDLITDEEWEAIQNALLMAVKAVNDFRKAEGHALANDLRKRVANILAHMEKILPHETNRIGKQKDKLRKHLDDFLLNEKVDHNRFEQEIIYYIEKIDITEEKVRLSQHCNFFLAQLENDEEQVGKVLSFICQEMGREINTLGSKAQDSEIQQIVINMKDELEKMKEQLMNIL